MTYPALLQAAECAARHAGHYLLHAAGSREAVWQDRYDVKLKADLESEALLRAELAATELPIIGEEQGGDATLTSRQELYWIIDPLDGTYNYLRGIPLACVSIGLMRGETPILGVVYDFNANELFAGLVGQGLFVHGKPCHPRWADHPGAASLQTGFPAGRDFSPAALAAFLGKMVDYQKIRAIGSAALSLAWVACGRFDVYYEESIRLWDVAAGLALVQAAGGVIGMTPSSSGKFLAYDVWAAGSAQLVTAKIVNPSAIESS